jgi:nucleolar GTP-binding protein
MSVEELIDVAFRRVSKVQVSDRNKFRRAKKLASKKLATLTDTFCSKLSKYAMSLPNPDEIHAFYYELIDILVGIDKLRMLRESFTRAEERLRAVADRYRRVIDRSRNIAYIGSQLNVAYNRMVSEIKRSGKRFKELEFTRIQLKKIPSIDLDTLTIVVAGYPNVGKSYPFTTQDVVLGHFEWMRRTYQIMDTPGLLDRNPEERNRIERQAIAALKHIAAVIVFLLDPSEHCGYSLDTQLALLEKVKVMFKDTPLLVVETKVDLKRSGSSALKVSARTGEGIDELKRYLAKMLISGR